MMNQSQDDLAKEFPPIDVAEAVNVIRSVSSLLDSNVDFEEVRTWRQLVPILLSENGRMVSSGLSFLTGKLWSSVIAAWIVAASNVDLNDRAFDYLWADAIVTLDPQAMDEVNGRGAFADQVENLNEGQKSVIGQFARVAMKSGAIRQYADDWRQRQFNQRVLDAWPITKLD
jgi:hypothetical protein